VRGLYDYRTIARCAVYLDMSVISDGDRRDRAVTHKVNGEDRAGRGDDAHLCFELDSGTTGMVVTWHELTVALGRANDPSVGSRLPLVARASDGSRVHLRSGLRGRQLG